MGARSATVAFEERNNGHGDPRPQAIRATVHDSAGEDLAKRIVREFDAIELTDDCTNPLAHASHHQPHPDTGRTVCGLCHPPTVAIAGNGSLLGHSARLPGGEQ